MREKSSIIAMFGGLAERFKAAVLKTVEVKASAGSNPVSSASRNSYETNYQVCFVFLFMGLLWYYYRLQAPTTRKSIAF